MRMKMRRIRKPKETQEYILLADLLQTILRPFEITMVFLGMDWKNEYG